MHCAAYYGHYTLIPLLLKYGLPIKIKNYCDNLPLDEACTPEIQRLLKNAGQNNIHNLQEELNESKMMVTTIDIKEKGEIVIRKILLKSILKNYSSHVDAFHGTSFHAFGSIAKHGLRPSGASVQGKSIAPVKGHIRRGAKINGIENWSDAIFVSPSVYYAGHPIYAKVMINNDKESWVPIVQVKVKNGTFTSHDHTFGEGQYKSLEDEPISLEFRVEVKQKYHENLIMRNEKMENVEVVALILIRKGYLDDHEDYYRTTELLINSAEEKEFRKQL